MLYLLVGVAFFATSATADSIDDPQLAKSIEAWLDYDDEKALPLLSKLAQSGNEDAMLLLGQINIRSVEFSPYLKSLDIKSRNALIRAKGGLSGKSWFNFVETQKELATALIDINHTNKRIAATKKLLKFNEWGLATSSLGTIFNQGFVGLLYSKFYEYDVPHQFRYHFYVMASLADENTLNKDGKKQRVKLAGKLEESFGFNALQAYLFLGYAGNYLNEKKDLSTIPKWVDIF